MERTMKKETAVLGFIIFAAAGFLIGRQTAGDATDATTSKTASSVAKLAADTPSDSDILPVGKSYAKGPASAAVTIIEFSEFQCPFCSRVNPTMDKVRETYGDKVRIVFKHNPLSFHKDAPYAAQASLAAGKQGKFWEMHDILFKNQKALKKDQIEGYAKQIELDLAKFKADADSAEIKKMVDDDMALAKKVGARGTPNFFVNGEQLSGAQPYPKFKAAIDKALKDVEAATKAGTAPGGVYAAMVKKNYKAPAARKGAKPRRAAPDTKTVYKIPLGNLEHAKGGKEPLVNIIEFSEFQCPFCSRVLPTLKKIEDTYGDKVRIVFKHNPLPFHKDAPLAAEASLAAGAQGKFWAYHDKLFANMKKLKRDNLDAYAKELGLDMGKFKADLDSGKFKKQVAADQALARQFGARGTPNFFVNGRQITGARPFPSFKTIIDEEIKKAEKLLAAGTAKKDLYAKLTAKGKTKAAPPPKRAPRAQDNTVYKMPIGANDARSGKDDALVTIVEFSEFQCPFCSRVLPTLDSVKKKYGDDVRIIFKHNPLPFHKDAPLAAQASLAADKQGKFWPYHDVLFKNMKALKRDNLMAYAKQVGLNIDQFKADLDSPALAAQVKADQAVARQFGAGGTPNFFINGRKLVGAQPLASFTKVIDEEIKKAKALVAKGTPRSKVYAELTKKGATKAASPKRKPQAEDKTVYTVPVNPGDAIKGNKNAKITIVEFSEFQCPFCSRVLPTLDQVQKEYGDKVRIVFKHNPLSFHKDAPLAAEAALAAGGQGKFWEYHDILFKNMRALKRPQLEGYAQELGLNMGKFKGDLDSGKYKKQVQTDMALAQKLGARGTPTFFINGRKLRGAQPFPSFKRLIDEMLKK